MLSFICSSLLYHNQNMQAVKYFKSTIVGPGAINAVYDPHFLFIIKRFKV